MAAPKSSQRCVSGAKGKRFSAFFRRCALVLVAVAFLFGGVRVEPTGFSFGVTPAAAQSAAKGKRKTLFQAIFGQKKAKRRVIKKRKKQRKVKRKVRRKKVRRQKSRKRKTAKRARKRKAAPKRASAAAVPQPADVSKSDNARTVLVAGDFYAGSLADGLEDAFQDNPDVVIVDRSNGLSGFVRTDIVNWPEKIGPLVQEVKPDYLIFMAGSNDRQLLRENGVRHEKLTPGWETAYRGRISSMGAALTAADVPFTWVGLPSVRFSTMSRDFLNFNEWYSATVSKSAKGKFTDVWDGFADANGNYTRSGPDINGQMAVLRRKDGINMTTAGKRRLAFYVESDIRKMLEGAGVQGGSAAGEFEGLAGLPAQKAVYDPQATGRTVIVNLNDPAVDGGQVLAGETVLTESDVGSSSALEGEMPKGASIKGRTPTTADTSNRAPGVATAPEVELSPVGGPSSIAPQVKDAAGEKKRDARVGRVDDFSWPPREPEPLKLPTRSVAESGTSSMPVN